MNKSGVILVTDNKGIHDSTSKPVNLMEIMISNCYGNNKKNLYLGVENYAQRGFSIRK